MTSTATTGTTYPSVDMNRGEFHNEPFIDFSQPDNRKAMEAAMALVKGMFGRDYPLTIGGQRITTTEKIHSHNPSHPDQVVGIFQKATVEMANKAVENAHTAFERWKRVPAEERVACVYRTADILRKRRYELDAWLSFEIGKTWPEADADIAELIDFCEYYGREALRLGAPQKLTPMRGREKLSEIYSVGRGHRDSALEFCCGDYGRDDFGCDRYWKHRGGEAVERFADDRRDLRGYSLRGGRAGRRGQFLHRSRQHGGRSAGDESQDALHRFHGIERGGPAYRRASHQDAARPGVDQAHRAGNGRQGRDRRG